MKHLRNGGKFSRETQDGQFWNTSPGRHSQRKKSYRTWRRNSFRGTWQQPPEKMEPGSAQQSVAGQWSTAGTLCNSKGSDLLYRKPFTLRTAQLWSSVPRELVQFPGCGWAKPSSIWSDPRADPAGVGGRIGMKRCSRRLVQLELVPVPPTATLTPHLDHPAFCNPMQGHLWPPPAVKFAGVTPG